MMIHERPFALCSVCKAIISSASGHLKSFIAALNDALKQWFLNILEL